MLERVVGYLRSNGVSFRLMSYPAPEPQPEVAVAIPKGGLLVTGHVILAAGRPAIVCTVSGASTDVPRIRYELDTEVVDGTPDDLPPPFKGASMPLPPLGGLYGVPLLVDDFLVNASPLVFCAFANFNFFEIDYEDFAVLERPKIGSFATFGALPEETAPTH